MEDRFTASFVLETWALIEGLMTESGLREVVGAS